ncbi:hypothetical protein PV10_08930 [Exophiala mesophila]|uniref:MAPEG family protein n=1 Tax=Exophiala mesophila TaxID=212818 RepID=A0A0D1Z630_EXOME|nr:uncharacterized protein PV10_08930 [Exophiala mesophila]KIV89354.1 hypothetical protein PV10_08930 [Exophiala mesophila]
MTSSFQTSIPLPVTASFAPAFAAYFILLNLRTSKARVESNTYMGNDVAATKPDNTKQPLLPSPAGHSLQIESRSHSNYVENVPFALLLTAFVEANGGNPKALTVSLLGLLFFRVVHVEFGLRAKNALGWGRPVGYFGTLAYVAALSGYGAWLVRSFWIN